MCHLPLLAPIFAIAFFWLWPISVAAPAYAVTVVFSVLLYALTLRVMRSPGRTGAEGLLLRTGEVVEHNAKGARIRISGEIWQAVSSAPLRLGERVRVVGREGMTLRVRHVDDDRDDSDDVEALAGARR